MKSLQEIQKAKESMQSLAGLTGVFEGIASMKISQVKNQVLQSQHFFDRLWQMYSQINVDTDFDFGRHANRVEVIDKELYIVITSEGGFSGDIDQRLINWMLESYDETKNDIIVIGSHGAIQLSQLNISFEKYFKLTAKDQNINVTPIIKEVQKYRSTYVFYQTYQSLMIQNIKKISLSKAVEEKGKGTKMGQDVINEETYIFEPSTYAVVNHLERSMLNIALSQAILDSKLAQYASRFQAMNLARHKADDSVEEYTLAYAKTKRDIKDERLKEIVNGLRKTIKV